MIEKFSSIAVKEKYSPVNCYFEVSKTLLYNLYNTNVILFNNFSLININL